MSIRRLSVIIVDLLGMPDIRLQFDIIGEHAAAWSAFEATRHVYIHLGADPFWAIREVPAKRIDFNFFRRRSYNYLISQSRNR